MFARTLTYRLRKDSAPEFNRVTEDKIVPLLRKQKGFRDLIVFLAPERPEVLAISLWDTHEDAEAYNRAGFAEALETLSKVIEGTPKVQTFDVAFSTLHRGAAKTA